MALTHLNQDNSGPELYDLMTRHAGYAPGTCLKEVTTEPRKSALKNREGLYREQ